MSWARIAVFGPTMTTGRADRQGRRRTKCNQKAGEEEDHLAVPTHRASSTRLFEKVGDYNARHSIPGCTFIVSWVMIPMFPSGAAKVEHDIIILRIILRDDGLYRAVGEGRFRGTENALETRSPDLRLGPKADEQLPCRCVRVPVTVMGER